MKTTSLFIIGMMGIAMIAPECRPKVQLGESEHTDQNQTQQESDQLVADTLLDALAINTSTATAAAVTAIQYLGPKDFR